MFAIVWPLEALAESDAWLIHSRRIAGRGPGIGPVDESEETRSIGCNARPSVQQRGACVQP